MAGRRKANDHRNLLIHEYIKFVRLVRPQYLILENVRGITSTLKQGIRGRPSNSATYEDLLYAELLDAGFYTYPRILKAYDFGVPQRRPRFIMIGVRTDTFTSSGIEPDFFDPFDDLDMLRKKFLTSKGLPKDGRVGPEKALSDLEERRNKLIDCVDSSGFKQVKYQKPLNRLSGVNAQGNEWCHPQ